MDIKEYINKNITIIDGALGTELQKRGLKAGELPERWNITHATEVIDIHLSYLKAGCDIVTANTFGANSLKFNLLELEEIVKSAIENAKLAVKDFGKPNKFVALDIGPLGKLLKPYGDLEFEQAVEIFKMTAVLGEKYGADLVVIETMNDLYETKAAVLAVKESTSLPIFVSNVFNENGKLMTGSSVEETVCTLQGLGVTALGANCSLGPKELAKIITKTVEISNIPTLFMPNAGLPKIENGKTVYDVSPKDFAKEVLSVVERGVRIVGGCCGTTPEYIKEVKKAVVSLSPKELNEKRITAVCSGQKTVIMANNPVAIGERINPTGKKRFKQALIEKDMAYILEEGVKQQEKGAHILDVNVGIPDICENTLLPEVITELQAVVDLPLQIDTSNVQAMESAMRLYNGKPLINSVNGKKSSMKQIFPLVKKYGGVVVCLTLDENGIPETPEARAKIAVKIADVAKEYGIPQSDLIFDPLCMTVSTNKNAGDITLNSIRLIQNYLNGKTVLGISNISYGLPDREKVNAEFLTLALNKGLNCAIINPLSETVMQAFYGKGLTNGDKPSMSALVDSILTKVNKEMGSVVKDIKGIKEYVMRGQKASAVNECKRLLETRKPLEIINEELIPALDEVGKLYEQGKMYLPQLLMSAECVKACFDILKGEITQDNNGVKKCKFVIATVEGDIHDIGKNIVKLLLENYGFEVIDLGKDVPKEKILSAVIENNAPMLGLSALMTTTVPAMENTVKLVKEKAPWCKIVVGGAVLTKEYADKMGATYSKDALSTVRFAEMVFNQK